MRNGLDALGDQFRLRRRRMGEIVGRFRRFSIASLMLMSLNSALVGSAQEPSADDSVKQAEEPSRITYVLIDASGSMADEDAEGEVAKIEKEILLRDPDSLISRTYFRASNREACWAPVEIADAVPATESRPTGQSFFADFTPLGEALRSAILHAGSGPADILLVTDEEETPACGIDICTVANSLLPRDGITVRVVPVRGASAGAHDRLGCIEGAQGKIAPPIQPAPLESSTDEEHGGAIPSTSAPVAWLDPITGGIQFIENWLWLIGFGCVAYAAYLFGSKHISDAIAVEGQTAEVKSLQFRIEQGDDPAKGELDSLIKTNAQDKKFNPSEKEERRVSTSIRWWGCVGIAILFLIAVLPDFAPFGGFSWAEVKRSAWGILNSEFSTAFAVMWIAVIFFAASQAQRHQEALRNYRIATREAQKIAEAKRTELHRQIYSDYLRAREVAEHYVPTAPLREFDDESLGETDEDAMAFVEIRRRAIEKGVGNLLPSTTTIAELMTATQWLRGIVQKPMWVSTRRHFAEYIRRLVNSGALMDSVGWRMLRSSIDAGNSDSIRDAVRELVKEESIELGGENPPKE